jgi:hypothetical protein
LGRTLVTARARTVEPPEIIFEERDGHDYDHTLAYIGPLRMQAETGVLLLKSPGLNPILLGRTHWRVEKKDGWAGLQFADLLASASNHGANASSLAFDIEPAKTLDPVIGAPHRRRS